MMSKNFLLAAFECSIVLITVLLVQVQAQTQSGYISIDCGTSKTSNYIDETTSLTYISDTNFTEAGENHEVTASYKLITYDEKQLWDVRSFPEGARNCYTLKPTNGKGQRYLIRARFMYGNYDNQSSIPKFDLYIGADHWNTIVLKYSWSVQNEEIIHSPLSDYIHVCLVNTGFGVPFISALELRPLNNETYVTAAGTSLQLYRRLDFASVTNRTTRYKDDVYDRLWTPAIADVWKPLNVSLQDDNSISNNLYEPPSAVMSTAYTRNNSISYMGMNWAELNISSNYFFFMHFAELEKLRENQTREFDIYMNNDLWYGPLAPQYLSQTTIYSSPTGKMPDSKGNIMIWINKTRNSTLPPLINAMEIYVLKELSQQETDQADVDAILNIKMVYEVKRNWQGDPCAPMTYVWDGLQCSYDDANSSHRITSLNLSSSGLVGEISPFIASLTMLQNLDLSNNSLTGMVPEFLAQLSSLRVLNLKGNNLKGPLPASLLERTNNGGLSLSVDANVMVNQNSSSPSNETSSSSSSPGYRERKNTFVVPLFSTIGSGVLLYFVL